MRASRSFRSFIRARRCVERYARHALHVLEDPGFTTPPPRVEGLWDRPWHYAAQIRKSLESFEASLAAIEAQKREVEVALIAKTEHLEQIKDRLKWSTRSSKRSTTSRAWVSTPSACARRRHRRETT